jgi:predicted Rdx family selenoprotein
MAATYSDTDRTPRNRARELIGDTTVTPNTTTVADPLMSDAHIDAVLSEQGMFELGVAWLADELLARFAQDPIRVTIDGVTTDMSAWVGIWRDLASRLRTGALIDQAALPPAAAQSRVGIIRAGTDYKVR